MPKLSEQDLDLLPLLAETEDESCGALVVFGGVVRNHHDQRPVSALTYTAHNAIAEKVIAEVEAEAKEKFGVPQCQIVHRVGDLAIGDTAVYAVVRAAHRGAAFEAAKYAIDKVKERAPIWKQERYADGQLEYRDGAALQAPDE